MTREFTSSTKASLCDENDRKEVFYEKKQGAIFRKKEKQFLKERTVPISNLAFCRKKYSKKNIFRGLKTGKLNPIRMKALARAGRSAISW